MLGRLSFGSTGENSRQNRHRKADEGTSVGQTISTDIITFIQHRIYPMDPGRDEARNTSQIIPQSEGRSVARVPAPEVEALMLPLALLKNETPKWLFC